MKKQQNLSQFPKFETAGDSVEGVFGGFEKSNNPDIPAPNLKIGDKKIGISASIKSHLAPVLDKLIVGKSRLKIVYLETRKTSDRKRNVKVFDVYLNGKRLEGMQGMPLSKDEVKEFFNAPSVKGTSKKK